MRSATPTLQHARIASPTGRRLQRLARLDLSIFDANTVSAPGLFLQSLQPAAKRNLCGRTHPVDEQNSIEMVDLVLQCAREQPTRFNFNLTVQSLRAHHG